MAVEGNVVREFYIEDTHVRICDDYCRNKTREEVEAILQRIARNAFGPLSVAALEDEKDTELEKRQT